MRRMWMGQLILLLTISALINTSRFARAADLPYEGNWKVILLIQNVGPMGLQLLEVNAWLVKVDKEGKKIEVLSTIPDPGLKGTKAANLKATSGALHFLIKFPNNNEWGAAFYTPKGKEKAGSLLGAVRRGSEYVPARFEKTDLAEIDLKSAAAPTSGFADLKAALETKDPEDRYKDLEDTLKTYEGKMVTFFTSQQMLFELTKKKAEAAAFKPIAEGYVKTAALHGREMEIQAHVNLSRQLIGYDKTSAMALMHAQQAAKRLEKDDFRGTRLEVFLNLASALHKHKKENDIKETLKSILDITEDVIEHPRIPSPRLATTQQMALTLLGSPAPAVADAGLAYARKMQKLLTDESSLNDRLVAQALLWRALMIRGTALKDEKLLDEAKLLAVKIEKIESDLDKEYLKTAIPFKPGKFAGRKGKSERAVVVEMFTSAQVRPPVPANIAFAALGKTYSPKEVVLLQYHMHLPGLPAQPGRAPRPPILDPLASPDGDAREKFYTEDVEGPPAVFVDGKVTALLGGSDKTQSKGRYETLRELIDKALENNSEAKIKLDVKREGDKIDLSADVSDLKETGPKVKLRFLLVEDTVRYVGSNGLRLHYHVVRALPGGADGFKLEMKESSHKASVDVSALRLKLNGYLNAVAKKYQVANLPRPLALKKLKVVAMIQNDDSKKVFQAVQVDVPEAKEEKKEEKEKKEKD